MRQIRFRGSTLRVWDEERFCDTLFPDGRTAPASRECEVNNLSYAQHLGYDDCWPCLLEHEALHTFVSERMGRPHSPTLWAVAHDYGPGSVPYEEQLYEEAIVLAFQRFLHTRHLLPVLWHGHISPHLQQWQREFEGVQRRLLQAVPA